MKNKKFKKMFKVVPDTNIVIASEKSQSETSPNKEFFERWKNNEFDILYSDDTLLEYIEKLRHFNVPEETVKKLIYSIIELGIFIRIAYFHLPVFPSDTYDIAFLLCADNGNATHIITYDPHLKEIEQFYQYKICETLEFLLELRKQKQ